MVAGGIFWQRGLQLFIMRENLGWIALRSARAGVECFEAEPQADLQPSRPGQQQGHKVWLNSNPEGKMISSHDAACWLLVAKCGLGHVAVCMAGQDGF